MGALKTPLGIDRSFKQGKNDNDIMYGNIMGVA
jgi:hypothetical protein